MNFIWLRIAIAAILILITGFIDCAPIRCGLYQYTLKINNNVTCPDCPICLPGEGSEPQCGAFMNEDFNIECKSCEPGNTFSSKTGTGFCGPCSVCLENQLVEKKCDVTSNTVCGMCHAGYYKSIWDQCEKCPSCCKHSEDTKKLKKECQYQACQDYAAKTCVTTVKPMTISLSTGTTLQPTQQNSTDGSHGGSDGISLSTGATLQPTLQNSTDGSHGGSDGARSPLAIVGYIIGAICIIMLVVAMVLCYLKKRSCESQIMQCGSTLLHACTPANSDVDNETDVDQHEEHRRPVQEVGSPPTASTSGEETHQVSQPLLQGQCSDCTSGVNDNDCSPAMASYQRQ